MYVPKHFEVTDEAEIFAFIEANNFAQVTSQHEGRPYASHIPLLLSDDKKRLIGHLARSNPHHQTIENQTVLVTFQGLHDYISPSWFKTPGVPTWNYQAVHVYGQCKVTQDREVIAQIVDTLTLQHEASFEKPWKPEYRQTMLTAIVGIEISIEEIQGKYKLSQNRPALDQKGIVEGLDEIGSHSLAREMDRNQA